MASEYRPDRRIDAIRRLQPVTKNEAAEATDLLREQTVERERERLADELRASSQKKRSFADLLKKR